MTKNKRWNAAIVRPKCSVVNKVSLFRESRESLLENWTLCVEVGEKELLRVVGIADAKHVCGKVAAKALEWLECRG